MSRSLVALLNERHTSPYQVPANCLPISHPLYVDDFLVFTNEVTKKPYFFDGSYENMSKFLDKRLILLKALLWYIVELLFPRTDPNILRASFLFEHSCREF